MRNSVKRDRQTYFSRIKSQKTEMAPVCEHPRQKINSVTAEANKGTIVRDATAILSDKFYNSYRVRCECMIKAVTRFNRS